MINFMLGQVEHESGIFASEPRYCKPFVCAAFGLCLDRVVGYAGWSHTFCSFDLGRKGGDLLCGGIL